MNLNRKPDQSFNQQAGISDQFIEELTNYFIPKNKIGQPKEKSVYTGDEDVFNLKSNDNKGGDSNG